MFYLKDLPDKDILNKYSENYPEFDAEKFDACVNMLKIGSECLKTFENLLNQHNFSQARFLVLMILMRNPEVHLSPTAIADKMGVKKPTITGIINNLIKEELVQREFDTKDRRKFKIKISDKGIKHLKTILPDYFNLINKIMENFNKKDLKEIISLLKKIKICV